MNEVNKLARTVLRGGRGSNAPDLPDFMSAMRRHAVYASRSPQLKKNEAMLIDFSKLRALLPYINTIAIFFGVSKLILYYREFHIDIVQYIDISEILTLFLRDIFFFVALNVLPLVIFSILFGHKLAELHNEVAEKILDNQSFWKRLLNYLKQYGLIIVLAIVFSVIGHSVTWFIFFWLTVIYLLYELRFTMNKRYGMDLHPTYHNIILWTMLTAYFGYSNLQQEIQEVRACWEILKL